MSQKWKQNSLWKSHIYYTDKKHYRENIEINLQEADTLATNINMSKRKVAENKICVIASKIDQRRWLMSPTRFLVS